MVLLEQGEASPAHSADHRLRVGVTVAIALTLLAVIVMNVALILSLTGAQSDEIGNM